MGANNPNAGGAPGGGGKGGMGMNRGPGGNAQNNPGMHQFAQLGQQFNGLGSAGVSQMPAPNMPGNPINATANSVGQSMGGPMGNWQSMLKGLGSGGGMPAFNLPHSYGGGGPNGPSNLTSISGMGFPGGGREQTIEDLVRMEKGWGVGGGGGNLTPPTPQPQEPIGGYIGGQPAQWHYQAEALKKPPVNSVGLPTGGILAKLYGG